MAAFAMGLIGDPSAIDRLVASLKDNASEVRARAAEALGRIGDPRATAAGRGDGPGRRAQGRAPLAIRGDDPGSAADPWLELRLGLFALARLKDAKAAETALLSAEEAPLRLVGRDLDGCEDREPGASARARRRGDLRRRPFAHVGRSRPRIAQGRGRSSLLARSRGIRRQTSPSRRCAPSRPSVTRGASRPLRRRCHAERPLIAAEGLKAIAALPPDGPALARRPARGPPRAVRPRRRARSARAHRPRGLLPRSLRPRPRPGLVRAPALATRSAEAETRSASGSSSPCSETRTRASCPRCSRRCGRPAGGTRSTRCVATSTMPTSACASAPPRASPRSRRRGPRSARRGLPAQSERGATSRRGSRCLGASPRSRTTRASGPARGGGQRSLSRGTRTRRGARPEGRGRGADLDPEPVVGLFTTTGRLMAP